MNKYISKNVSKNKIKFKNNNFSLIIFIKQGLYRIM